MHLSLRSQLTVYGLLCTVASLVSGCRLPEACDCDAGADVAPPPADAGPWDAARRDAAAPDAALDPEVDRGADPDAAPPPPDAAPPPPDHGPDRALDAAPADLGPAPDAAPPDAAPPCVAETCDGRDEDCDGRIDEGSACAAAVLAGCRLGLEIRDTTGAVARGDSGGDQVFHAISPPADLDGGDALVIDWRCTPDLAWAEAACVVTLAHADGSAPDPNDCATARCTTSSGGDPLVFASDVDGDDRFAIAFACADPAAPDRAAGVAAGVQAWFATQHRRVDPAGGCLDEALFDGSPSWGFCPGEPVDDEGRHRCAGSAGDGRLHAFPVGTEGGFWPDLGPCDGLGIALTPTR